METCIQQLRMQLKKQKTENMILQSTNKNLEHEKEKQNDELSQLKKSNEQIRVQLKKEKDKNENNEMLIAEATKTNLSLQKDIIQEIQILKGTSSNISLFCTCDKKENVKRY